ncbi:hypothetical protein ES705_30828 [subsurface metagenome]
MHVIEECLDYLLGIGKKLSGVLSLREKIGTPESKSESLDTIILRGKSFSLPYEEEVIKSGTITNGRTVLEALTMVISMSFLAAIFFNDQNTTSLLIHEQEIDQKIRSKLEILERIADPETYLELRALCTE